MRDGDDAARQAVILPFPEKGDPAAQDRLRRALAGLDNAIARQRQAVSEWQSVLHSLRGAIHGLHGAASAQERTLGELAENIAGLHGESLRLQAWGETTLGAQG